MVCERKGEKRSYSRNLWTIWSRCIPTITSRIWSQHKNCTSCCSFTYCFYHLAYYAHPYPLYTCSWEMNDALIIECGKGWTGQSHECAWTASPALKPYPVTLHPTSSTPKIHGKRPWPHTKLFGRVRSLTYWFSMDWHIQSFGCGSFPAPPGDATRGPWRAIAS